MVQIQSQDRYTPEVREEAVERLFKVTKVKVYTYTREFKTIREVKVKANTFREAAEHLLDKGHEYIEIPSDVFFRAYKDKKYHRNIVTFINVQVLEDDGTNVQ